jgi:uncharacterized protein (DUF1778 family)
MAKVRTALLVRCSDKEAEAIREAAHRERRTISGYILNAVLNRIAHQKKIVAVWQAKGNGKRKALAVSEAYD